MCHPRRFTIILQTRCSARSTTCATSWASSPSINGPPTPTRVRPSSCASGQPLDRGLRPAPAQIVPGPDDRQRLRLRWAALEFADTPLAGSTSVPSSTTARAAWRISTPGWSASSRPRRNCSTASCAICRAQWLAAADEPGVEQLIEQLYRRRSRVADLIEASAAARPSCFTRGPAPEPQP